MTRRHEHLALSCPSDGCPLRAFAAVRATLGYTIHLHGCRYCRFDLVVAVAEDAQGNVLPVAQWHYNAEAGLYLLAAELGRNPPGWLDAAAAALPLREPAG